MKNKGDSPEKETLDLQNPELRVCSLEAHLGYSWFLFLTVFGEYPGLVALRVTDSKEKKKNTLFI